MIPIIGNTNVVIFADPIAKAPHTFRWWAERGLIHWENQTNGSYGSQSIRDTLERLKAIQDMCKNSRGSDDYMHPEAIVAYQTYIDGMIHICQRAKQQGSPDDPNVSKQKAAEIKAQRHSRNVIVPGLVPSF